MFDENFLLLGDLVDAKGLGFFIYNDEMAGVPIRNFYSYYTSSAIVVVNEEKYVYFRNKFFIYFY